MSNRARFVLVKNAQDLNRIQVLRPDLLRSATALAATPHAALLLREYGVSRVVSLGDLLAESDRLACLREAHRLSQTWPELLDGLTSDNVKLAAQLLRDDLLTFFLHATAAHQSVRALCDQSPGGQFLIFPGTPRPSIWQSEYDCSHGLIEAAIHDFASRGCARIEYIRPRPRWHPTRILHRLMRTAGIWSSAAGSRSTAAGRESCGLEIGWSEAIRTRRPLALAIGDDISLAVMSGYAPGLEAAGYAVLGASTSVKPVVTSNRIRACTGCAYFRVAAMPGGSGTEGQIDFVASRQHVERVRLTHALSAFRNPFLSFQYDQIFYELLPRAVATHAAISRALDALTPSLVLVGSHGFTSHAAAVAARARGIPSVFVQHGGALTWLHSTSADVVWAWGALPAEIIRKAYAWPDACVAAVGAPQLANIRRESPSLRASVRRRLQVAFDGRMLLVLTSGGTDGPWQPVVAQSFIEAWDRLLEWTAQNPDVTVVLRPHPLMDMSAWYRALAARRRLKNLRIAEDGSVDDIVCGADAVVVMEVTTTAALVAHAAGCPVLHVRSARWNAEGDAVWTEDRGLTVARQPAQIASMLDRILNDEAAREACVQGGQRFFDAYVADDHGLQERVRAAAARALRAANGSPTEVIPAETTDLHDVTAVVGQARRAE